jgi:hypothetical protein
MAKLSFGNGNYTLQIYTVECCAYIDSIICGYTSLYKIIFNF